MSRNPLDSLLDYTQTKRGRENLALTVLAAGCVAGILVIGRL
ncbi:MAG TPA: hypothetical protein VF176_02275 [Solirubrobacterales bacterium]